MRACYYLILLIALLPFEQLNAQWEQVPLKGGHIDRFIPSIYDSNIIFAFTRYQNIYYSKERCKNWKQLFDKNRFKPTTDIMDIAITKKGTLILLGYDSWWRSENFGISWNEITGQVGNLSPRQVQMTKSGRIMVLSIGPGTIYSSGDDGLSWFKIETPKEVENYIHGFYVEPDSGNIIIIYGIAGKIAQSGDGGRNWTINRQFDDPTQFVRPSKCIDQGAMQFGLIASGKQGMHYYLSIDSGKTWDRKDRVLPALSRAFSDNSILLIHSSNVILLAASQDYFISFNGGIDWSAIESLHPWSLVGIGDTIVGSFILTGTCLSKDEGRTWNAVDQAQNFTTFKNIQYRSVDRDAGFAIVCDNYEYGPDLYELCQTTDRGRNWKILFQSPALDQLFVRSYPEARYYAMSRNREIITGVIDQTVPDTIVAWKENSRRSYFVSTDAFPDYMYVSSMTEPHLGTLLATWNGGSTWEESILPYGWFDRVTLTPSITHPDFIVGVGYPTFGSVDELLGIYVNPHLGGWIHQSRWIVNCSLVENDLLFQGDHFSFSSDYGSNWSRNLRGLDSSFDQANVPFFMSRDRLFICTDWNGQKLWYYFRDGSWHPVRDGTGNPIQSPAPGMLEMIEDDLYAAYPYEGLFRLSNGLTTGTDRPANSPPRPSLLSCYPNPFHNSTEISFTLSERARVVLLVVDIFGRTVARLVDEEKDAGSHRIRFDGGGLANGMYFYRLTAKNISLTGKMCLVR